MGKYIYEFKRFGCLDRQNGISITDMHGNYICGKPQLVWWWPINWVVVALLLPLAALTTWRKRRTWNTRQEKGK